MKKVISVVLCVLMLLSVCAVAASAYELPATPETISFENCVATWAAVDGAAGYRVQLYVWNYDEGKLDTWTWMKSGSPVLVTEGTQADLSELVKAGYYTFTVASYTEKTLNDDGKIFRLFGEESALPKTFTEEDPIITKVDANYPWSDVDGELNVDTEFLPEGGARDFLSLIKKLFEIISNFFNYILSFQGVKDLVK